VERKQDVIEKLQKHKLAFVERSKIETALLQQAPDVFLVDTTGESRNFYSVADVIFIGKSLTAHGGQNIIEPAFYGKPIVVGPYVENFVAIVSDFLEAHAIIQVNDAKELEVTIAELLSDSKQREKLGISAKNLVSNKMGSIEKTVKKIMAYLKSSQQ
jgi:3-deoxy-D-manno-octulosonic-acid transferase